MWGLVDWVELLSRGAYEPGSDPWNGQRSPLTGPFPWKRNGPLKGKRLQRAVVFESHLPPASLPLRSFRRETTVNRARRYL